MCENFTLNGAVKMQYIALRLDRANRCRNRGSKCPSGR